jgi:hypothetical protein
MPLVSNPAKNAASDARYGDGRASNQPATWVIRLYDGDPEGDGNELDNEGGYAAVTVNNDSATWPDAVGGVKHGDIEWPMSTGAWSGVARWAGIHHPNSNNLWEKVRLASRVRVSEAGTIVVTTLTIFY